MGVGAFRVLGQKPRKLLFGFVQLPRLHVGFAEKPRDPLVLGRREFDLDHPPEQLGRPLRHALLQVGLADQAIQRIGLVVGSRDEGFIGQVELYGLKTPLLGQPLLDFFL